MSDRRDAELVEAVRRAVEAAPPAPTWNEIERRLAAADGEDPGNEPSSSRSILIAAMVVVLAGLIGLLLRFSGDREVRLDTDPVATTMPPVTDPDDGRTVQMSFGEWSAETEPAVVQVCLARAAARLDDQLQILPPASGPDLQGWNTERGRAVRYLRHHRSMQDLLDLDDPSIEEFDDETWAREVAAIEALPRDGSIEGEESVSLIADVVAARSDASIRQPDTDRCWTDRSEVLDRLTPVEAGEETARSNLRCLRAARASLVLVQLADPDVEVRWWDIAESALIEMDEDGAGPDTADPTIAAADARFATGDERSELLEEAGLLLRQYATGLEPACSVDLSYP